MIALTVALAATLCLLAIAPLFAEGAPMAQVSYLDGGASYKVGEGEYKPLVKDAKLGADSTVKTTKNGKVELTLPDQSVLRIAPLSVVALKSLLNPNTPKSKPSAFKVNAGRIWSNVTTAVGGEKKFEVQSETAVAGVRGTVFQVAVAEDLATVVKVYSGAVAVSNAPLYQKKPDKSGERTQVPGPQEVTKKQWEELIAKEMQQVRVAADGVISRTEFTLDPADAAWEQWNLERDKQTGIKH
jgi:hypothetical protein